jgi:hypothetical protein
MRIRSTDPPFRTCFAGSFLAVGCLAMTPALPAQGCAPVRFAAAVPGTEGDIYLGRGTWQVGLTYRRFSSNRLIQGHEDMGPSNEVRSQAFFTSLTYGVSRQLALSLNVPFAHGAHIATYPDGLKHQNTATGLGDISVTASYWLFDASSLRPGGNLGIGIGVKAPTGRNDAAGTWWTADGSTIPWPVHQSIELGDGGWGVILRGQGFQPLTSSLYLYGGGSYTLNPRKTTDVVRSPGSEQRWAVPDVWNASMGISLAVLPSQGFTARLGVEFDGTRKRDVLGGTDSLEHRLPATTGYVVPAVTLTRGAHTLTVSMGARIYKNFLPSVWDDAQGRKGGGGLAKYVFQTAYALRL